MSVKAKDLRTAIIASCRAMNALGLNQGTSGNISARIGDSMLITPSAIPYDEMRPEMLPLMPLGGEYGAWSGRYKPSSEWRFHLDILRSRPDVNAIVHCHATYCTALAMLHRPILAAHYMIALFGGPNVRCTAYAPYGTKDLSELAVAGLDGRQAVLLGNHGAIAVGETLAQAMFKMQELETMARMYYLALAVGRPVLLSDEEIDRTVGRFKAYGVGLERPDAGAKGKPTAKKGGRRAAAKAGGKRKAGAGKARPKPP